MISRQEATWKMGVLYFAGPLLAGAVSLALRDDGMSTN
jgi:hypothetical protein